LKIAVAGKRGVGKTTIAAWLARELAKRGQRIIAIDADPVPSLASALGFAKADEIVPIGKMDTLIEERTGAPVGSMGQMFKLNPSVEDLPEKLSQEDEGVRLLVMGTIEQAGGGCICPQSVFLKTLLRHLVLQRDDVVVLDMEAGVEHLGRATSMGVNVMYVVVEPGRRSVTAAKKIGGLAREMGVRKVMAVANKIRGDVDQQAIAKALAPELELAAAVDYDSSLVDSDLFGEPPATHGATAPVALQNLAESLYTESMGGTL
jgi:CO dehydrogenase maturation factor